MNAIPAEALRLLGAVIQRMRGVTGQVTWHFKEGDVLKVEYRTFEDVDKEAPMK